MEGEGSYTYARTKDVYSGSWVAGVKHGHGCYEYGSNKSKLNGIWEGGQITSGEWFLSGAAIFKGQFKNGRPYGPGEFVFSSGIEQKGEYLVLKSGTEEEGEGESREPTWAGASVHSTVA